MHQPNIFHEYIFMKIFTISSELDARKWFISLPAACIDSMNDFHIFFHSRYQRRYPIELIFENWYNEGSKLVLKHIEYSSYISEEEKEFTNDEFEQYFEREINYSNENEEDIISYSNEEVSSEWDYIEASKNR